MKLQLIRHATLLLEYAGVHFLIDPMLSEAEANPPIPMAPNTRRNPLVELPFSLDDMRLPDYVVVTHLHPDHWDQAAQEFLPTSLPVLCQAGDETTIYSAGFQTVTPIEPATTIGNIQIMRTGGQHGTGEIGQKMGKVSGFVYKAENEPTLYVAGDTIWCEEVQQAIEEHKPDVIIVNAGGAKFVVGDHITMNEQDVSSCCRFAPKATIIAVHMDTINHCLVTREDLRSHLEQEKLLGQVMIPEDGEWIDIQK
ncbi:MBL fold metallo-hydrolase [Brevibacillus laterosporus]|uniref:MBL fold metallo-hydrolase n=1 Tax=Brevibacillus laterosporus TaxID=1465 RepID=A0A518VAE8_BRELA|nr:MBL fold metallo-hydrolase [Brevibacillus laterosporus]